MLAYDPPPDVEANDPIDDAVPDAPEAPPPPIVTEYDVADTDTDENSLTPPAPPPPLVSAPPPPPLTHRMSTVFPEGADVTVNVPDDVNV